MTRKVKIGLVGTGEIGQVHAKAHSEVEGTQLCITAMVQPEKEKELSETYGVPLYESFDALLEDESVDAVDICLPNDLHREFAVKAMRAGKHVLCEKPIALTLEDADAMIEESRRADVFLMIAHPLRFWPEYLQAKAAIDAGELGDVLLMTSRRMVSLLAGTTGDRRWRHDPKRSGGAVIDMQIHDIDAFGWFFGTAETVVSRGLRSPDGALSHVFTHLEFPDGKQAFVESSYMMKGNPLDIGFRILGTKRSIEYKFMPAEFALHDVKTNGPQQSAPSLILYEWEKYPKVLYTPETDSFTLAFREEVKCFAESIRSGNAPTVATACQSRLALQIALASQVSCESGKVVRVGLDQCWPGS